MQTDFYDQIQTLRNTGNLFVIATVVRAEKPTSAKIGARCNVYRMHSHLSALFGVRDNILPLLVFAANSPNQFMELCC